MYYIAICLQTLLCFLALYPCIIVALKAKYGTQVIKRLIEVINCIRDETEQGISQADHTIERFCFNEGKAEHISDATHILNESFRLITKECIQKFWISSKFLIRVHG